MSSLKKCLFRLLARFFLFIADCLFTVYCKSSLCILIIDPYQIGDLQILSPILWIVFILSWYYPFKQKFCYFYFINSNLSIIFFSVVCALCVMSKKPLPYPRSQKLTLIFSFKSFTVLALIFRSLIHFELTYIWCEVDVQLHSLACGYQVVSAPFVKDCSFPLNHLATWLFLEDKVLAWRMFISFKAFVTFSCGRSSQFTLMSVVCTSPNFP